MKTLFLEIRRSVFAVVILAVVCCGIYPLLVFGIAQLAFPDAANGSLVRGADGAVRGSALIGQPFEGPQYFHPRPSSAGVNGYDAANSGGSNLGPTSKKLVDAVASRIAAYRSENHIASGEAIPADAVTASGSGLDPHISPKNARQQARRVALARGVAEDRLLALIDDCAEPPQFGVLGERRVNVLLLNLALDKMTSFPAQPGGRHDSP